MSANGFHLIYTFYETLLVASLIEENRKKVPKGLTTKIERLRLLYAINDIYHVKAISCGIIFPRYYRLGTH